MPNKSKDKGTRFEVELRNYVNENCIGISAVRARGSDGRSLGEGEDCDLKITADGDGELREPREVRVQAKVRANIAKYLQPTEGVDIVAFKQDRGPRMVLMTWEYFLELL